MAGGVLFLINLLLGAEITICEPDSRVRVEGPSATPDDPLYTQQWNFRAINVPAVWQQGQFGDPQRRVSKMHVTQL